MAVFLMENGVLSRGNKTPVTILQETLQRKGLVPHYELIYNGVGTMDPIFKYQVSADGFTAVGDGKSKKEAKHDAAAGLLKRMKMGTELSEAKEIDFASPYSGALKQNFVGMLDDICVFNKIPFPEYVPIREDGPPHARIFTMQVRVSTISETAVARTKKQAKHMAAQQMISRISKIMGDNFISGEKTAQSEDFSLLESNLKAMESGTYRHDLSLPIEDLHDVFFLKMEENIVPKSFLDLSLKPDEFYENLENPKEFLDDIVLGLEGLTKTIPMSIEALGEAFQEIEKDCEDEEDEESNYDVEEELNVIDYKSNGSYVGHQLEEFDLEEDVEQSLSNLNIESPKCSSVILESTSCEGLKDGDQLVGGSEVGPVFLYKTVECPQGKWVFWGTGKTELEAEKKASIKALKFLSAMSISTYKKETEGES